MESLESVMEGLSRAAGELLILAQEGIKGELPPTDRAIEFSDEMFDAFELVKRAMQAVTRASALG